MTKDEFEEQVAFMRIALAEHKLPEPESHLADQLSASIAEASSIHSKLIPVIKSQMKSSTETSVPKAPLEITAVLLVASQADDMAACPHLDSPAPMLIDLSRRWISCYPCVRTGPPVGHPPAHADQCEYCRQRNVTGFTPIITTIGPAMVSGEACDECVERISLPMA